MASHETFDIPIGKVVGPKGDTGTGIKSIKLLSTSGLVKTYRITMTDDTTFDFVVTDGNGITGASFDAQTNALTLTFDNGTSFTTPSLKGTKGDTGTGISKIEKTGTDGLVDTYTVTYTDGQTFTYTVTNGADGVSPEVTVTQISGGHTVEIEDADGVKTFDVLDGEVTETRLAEALATKAPVILETASGAIASFDDGADGMPVKKLVAQIEPVQDLHGQDSPYPAGGGKNKLKTGGLIQGAPSDTTFGNDTKRTFTLGTFVTNLTPNNYYQPNRVTQVSVAENAISVTTNAAAYALALPMTGLTVGAVYVVSAVKTNGIITVSFYKEDGAFISNTVDNPANFTVPAETYYTLIHFNPTGNDTQATYTDIQLELGSSATSFAPYENLCPISGWTGANVTRTGKNLFDKTVLMQYSGVVLNDDGSLYVNDNSVLYDKIAWKNEKEHAGQIAITYRYKFDNTGSAGLYPRIVYTDGTSTNVGVSVVQDFNTVTLITDANKTVDYITFTYGARTNSTTFFMQIELGSTATDYEPYTGNQISVTFPSEAGTVYGGTLTINPDRTGQLVVDHKGKDMGEMNWNYASSENRFYSSSISSEVKSTETLSTSDKLKCSIFKSSPLPVTILGTGGNGTICVYINRTVYARWLEYASANDFKTAVTGQILWYPLAAPITIPLTENEITGILSTLYGTNNIWADTGDVTCTYPADTKLYIDGKLAEIQATILENIGG